jgi:hypothetical protein
METVTRGQLGRITANAVSSAAAKSRNARPLARVSRALAVASGTEIGSGSKACSRRASRPSAAW